MKLLTAALLLLPLTLHAREKPVAPIPSLFTKAPAGRLTRFTRLCGMFMGRVDIVSAGAFRMKLNLELR
jgi:hypothetical protein